MVLMLSQSARSSSQRRYEEWVLNGRRTPTLSEANHVGPFTDFVTCRRGSRAACESHPPQRSREGMQPREVDHVTVESVSVLQYCSTAWKEYGIHEQVAKMLDTDLVGSWRDLGPASRAVVEKEWGHKNSSCSSSSIRLFVLTGLWICGEIFNQLARPHAATVVAMLEYSWACTINRTP